MTNYPENPTYVGMDRQIPAVECPVLRKPHVCGDGPATRTAYNDDGEKTPRMWGWTVTLPDFEAMADENPTYVGMDR